MSKKQATQILRSGGIIAYPTEAVWGLGCDPFQEGAVLRLLELKHRDVKKGVILIASHWEQISHLTTPIAPERLQAILATWPGPHTWVFPASDKAPAWLRGAHATIALRVTAHPVARKLCQAFGGPIVSTSANIEGQPAARDVAAIRQCFPAGIDLIIAGDTGTLAKPTSIRDAITGRVLR